MNAFSAKLRDLFSVDDLSDTFSTEEKKKYRMLASLSALPVFFWIPAAAHDQSAFLSFHANNGVRLFISCIFCALFSVVLGRFALGFLISLVLWIFVASISVFSSIDALSGGAQTLPLIGKIIKREFWK